MNKHLLASLLLASASISAQAGVEHLLPRVQQLQETSGCFAPGASITLNDPTSSPLLRSVITDRIGWNIGSGPAINVSIVASIPGVFNHNVAEYPDEAYTLEVTTSAINIQALTPTGVIRAAQTLRQLAMEGNGSIPAVNITDWPAFKVRGWMQDVGRSFLSIDELKRQIDLLSAFKVNTFHWHLTDYTGWRLQINAYPQLTSNAAITRFPGKFYTQEQAREIQDYAAQRGVTVIPEIDMPGHSHPFTQAMGHNMTATEADAELKTILDEVIALFDKAPYIHIGGDEVAFDDSFLIDKISYIHNKGKKVVIWNKYNSPAKLINPTTIKSDMCTNWATSGTLVQGLPNIDMRYNYTNHFDVFADLVGIYKSSIFNVQQGNDNVGGTISAAWNDTFTPTEDDIMRQNNQYANIIASASRAWQGGGKQYIETGGTTLPNSGEEYNDIADWERRFIYHKSTTLAPAKHQIPYVAQTHQRWYLTEQIPNGGSNTAVLGPEHFMTADLIPASCTEADKAYTSRLVTGAGMYLRHIWHGTVKGVYDNPQANMTAYAWTYVYSPTERDMAAFIETYMYSRSGNETGPLTNAWDRRGSRIWLNNTEIAAPKWTQPGKAIQQDHNTEGLTNENFTARPATPIHLKKGWNKIFLKLPHVNSGGTARDKWMFTFAIIDPTTQEAPTDLIYSPTRSMNATEEQLQALILEAEASIASIIGEIPGQFISSALDQAVSTKIAEIKATLDQDLTTDQRATQITELQNLFNAFKNGYTAGSIAQPQPGVYYNMCTPGRGPRYVSETDNALVGVTTPTAYAAWRFVKRNDGKYNIINHETNNFIAPTAANNSQLTTSATAPSAGWEIKKAANSGQVIIVSGTAELNQTNAGLNWKVYNWGSGTNTSDAGCQYLFSLANEEALEIPTPVITIVNRTLDGQNPLRIDNELAQKIFGTTSNSLAIDFTPDATYSNFGALAAASNTTADNAYYSVVVRPNNFGPRYWGNAGAEGWYTRGATLTANTRHKIVLVNDENNGYYCYYNGLLVNSGNIALSSLGSYGFKHFGNIAGANAITIGGIITASNGNKFPISGTIHSARLWAQPLSASEVEALPYNNLSDNTSTGVIENTLITTEKVTPQHGSITVEPADVHADIYDLQGRKIASGHGTIACPAGFVIVKIGNKAHKTLVK